MSTHLIESLRRDLLGGTAIVSAVVDRVTNDVSRYLVRSAPASVILNGKDSSMSEVLFVSEHVQMATELVHHEYAGPIAFEVPFNILIEHIEIYRTIAFKLLSSNLSLKIHVVFVTDMPEYEHEFLLAELAELVALGVDIILEDIPTHDDLLLASKILSVVDEIRMDISAKGITSYAHLSALMSSGLGKGARIGVILDADQDLPDFCSTYQRLSAR